MGIEDAIGDVDFYPNGLWDNQPIDCPNSNCVTCGCQKEWTYLPDALLYAPYIYNNEGTQNLKYI